MGGVSAGNDKINLTKALQGATLEWLNQKEEIMLNLIFKRQTEKLIKEAYVKGFNNGFEAGRQLQYAADHNKGVILSALVDKQIEEILRNKGV